MPTRKTTSSKSPKKSPTSSTGKKVTRSTGTSKKTTASSSTKSKTAAALKKNTSKLTTGTQSKPRTSKTTSTAKAKGKTSTRITTTTSKRQTKKPSVLKVMNSRKIEFFPHIETFPIFLHDLTENKRCWFCCIEHAQKYIDRYGHDYKCYQYTGK